MTIARSLAAVLGFLAAMPAGALRAQGLYDENILRTFELRFAQANWADLLAQNYASGAFLRASLTAGGSVFTDVGVRYRGNTSYTQIGTSPKKPFEIAIDEFVPGQRYLGYKTLNLNNGFRDPTFVREVLCYWIFRRFMPAPQANYCRLVINGESWGPYINVQQVNKDLMGEWFRDADGNRYRAERQAGSGAHDSALVWLGNDPTSYQRGYELKSDPSPTAWVDLVQLCDALNQSPASLLHKQLAPVLDDDLALRYLAGNNVVPAIDSYIGNTAHNYYLVQDSHHARFAIVPWDLNAAFGANNWLTVQQKVTLDPFYQATNAGRPLVGRLLGDARWRQRYLAHVRALLDTAYDWQILGGRVSELQRLIEADLAADGKRLYSMQLFRDNVTRDVQILVGAAFQWIPGLQSMVTGRAAFLRAHPEVAVPVPVIDQLAHAPPAPTVRDRVAVTARASGAAVVRLYWRARGAWLEAPMFDDGGHGDGAAHDGVFGAFVPAQIQGSVIEYYAGAETAAGAVSFAPRTAGHRPPSYRVEWPTRPSPVRLNELLASNTAGIRDEHGDREDWLELVNTGAVPAAVGGMHLTDDRERPARWRIPAGRVLAPGAALLVWADDEPAEGPLHATFKLDASGEELALFDSDGVTLLDHVRFGPQRSDESAGRLEDGVGPWVTFPLQQTPGVRNAASACGHRYYSALAPGTHAMLLRVQGGARIGSQDQWQITGAPPASAVLVLLAGAGGALPIPGAGVILLVAGPLLAALPLPTSTQGAAALALAVPDDARLIGARLFGAVLGPGAAGLVAANAVETTVCPR